MRSRPFFRRRRARPAAPTVLSADEPTATLTAVQSGVGVLRIEAAFSEAIGRFALGAIYSLASGVSSVVQVSPAAVPIAGPSRPVISGSIGRFQELAIDLRQSRDLVRLLVYLIPTTMQSVTWSGTLVATTFGGARIEVPIAKPASTHVQGLLSVHNIDGELVLRAEGVDVPGELRTVASAFGFDRISWLDGNTPLAP